MPDPQAGVLGVSDPSLYATLLAPNGKPFGKGGLWYDVNAYGADPTGVLDSSPAFAAAKLAAAVGGIAGRIFAPPGTYRLATLDSFGNAFTLDTIGLELEGAGRNATILSIDVTATYGLCARATYTRIAHLQVIVASTRTVTYAVGVTHPISAEQVYFECVSSVKGNGTVTNDFAVGPDVLSPDVSETHFIECDGRAATNANWIMGQGAGNVVNVTMVECTAAGYFATCNYGVYSNGTGFVWLGGTVQNHQLYDFFFTTPGGAPVSIKGVRSESSKKFWRAPSTGNDGLVSISDVIFDGTIMDASGAWIDHEMEGVLILDNVTCPNSGAVTPFPYAGGGIGPLIVVTRGFGQAAPVATSWNVNNNAIIMQWGYIQKATTTDAVTAVTPFWQLLPTTATLVAQSRVQGDTFDRYQVSADGTQKWGSGSAAPSQMLQRGSDGKIHFSGTAQGDGIGTIGVGRYSDDGGAMGFWPAGTQAGYFDASTFVLGLYYGLKSSIITSGALPTKALVSATGAQVSLIRDVNMALVYTTTTAAGTCKIELSPDNVTYTTLVTEAPGVIGTFEKAVSVPAGWYIKATVTNATLAANHVYY